MRVVIHWRENGPHGIFAASIELLLGLLDIDEQLARSPKAATYGVSRHRPSEISAQNFFPLTVSLSS